MTDFSEILDGTTTPKTESSGVSSISWGALSATLTGGTFVYEQNTSDTPVGTVTGGALEIKATVATGEYSGFGFYFGPNWDSHSQDSAHDGRTSKMGSSRGAHSPLRSMSSYKH